MIIIKAVILQALWFLVAYQGATFNYYLSIILGLIFLIFDYKIFKPNLPFKRYVLLAISFLLYGYVTDSILLSFNLIVKETYSYNFLLLWLFFIAYYESIFDRIMKLPFFLISFLGGIGGAFAYYSASKIGAFSITAGEENLLLSSVFICWALFFPISLRIYKMKSLKDYLLDKMIVTSFDSTGFVRHQKEFSDLRDISLPQLEEPFLNKKALVTGGTSGIGESVLSSLSNLHISVDFVGRSLIKGEEVEKKYSNSSFIEIDMGDWKAIKDIVHSLPYYDYIVLNAGGMPEKKTLNSENVELQCASQLLGHSILIEQLRANGKISETTKIVWVSSGGMYLKKLDLSNLLSPTEYDKVDTYANVKRAQVTLVEELVKNDVWSKYNIYSMHPGWVGTVGLEQALPKFYNLFRNRLRTPIQGADTIVWLLLTKTKLHNGGFYFDRKKVSPYFFKSYDPNDQVRKKLMTLINNFLIKG